MFWVSFLCLAATGAADTVSTTFRNLIRQLETPDRLRGRMIGVNMVFFIGGPQLGELEAGLVANWLGAVTSVVSGGLGCLAATATIAAVTPPLRVSTAGDAGDSRGGRQERGAGGRAGVAAVRCPRSGAGPIPQTCCFE